MKFQTYSQLLSVYDFKLLSVNKLWTNI